MNYVFVTPNTQAASTYMNGLSHVTLLSTTTRYLFWYRTGLVEADVESMQTSGNIRASVSTAYLESLV